MDTTIWINLDNAKIITSPSEEDKVTLSGCQNCLVDASKEDGIGETITFNDSKDRKSKNNVAKLSKDEFNSYAQGENYGRDCVVIDHSSDKHIQEYRKEFYGGTGEREGEGYYEVKESEISLSSIWKKIKRSLL